MTVQKYGYRVGIDKNSSPDYQAKPNDRRWKQSFMEVCPVEKDSNISSTLKIEPRGALFCSMGYLFEGRFYPAGRKRRGSSCRSFQKLYFCPDVAKDSGKP